MTYREIEPRDNARLASIIRATFDEFDALKEDTVYTDKSTDDLYTLFRTPKSFLWVVEKDNLVEGCAGVFPTEGLPEDCAEFVKFYVSPTVRGMNIGKNLMQKAIETAKKLGYKKLYLESQPSFNKAVSIYEKQGFVSLDAPMGNTGHHACDVWMLRDL